MNMMYSEFVRVMDISWQDMRWLTIWASIFMFIFIVVFGGCIFGWAIDWYKKNVLPKIYDGIVEKLRTENKRLKAENNTLSLQKENHYTKVKLAELTVNDLAKSNRKAIEKALEEIRNAEADQV